jgi:hypothetical protein
VNLQGNITLINTADIQPVCGKKTDALYEKTLKKEETSPGFI